MSFCSRVANALEGAGFRKGDAIAINMPMNVHAVVIYLATVLAGCAVVSIADSFAPSEIASRLTISKAKAIFTQVCRLHLHFHGYSCKESIVNDLLLVCRM